MDRDSAIELLDRLHAAQNEFYGGGDDAALRELLTPQITWSVPGENSTAGVYEGTEAVFGTSAGDAIWPRRRSG